MHKESKAISNQGLDKSSTGTIHQEKKTCRDLLLFASLFRRGRENKERGEGEKREGGDIPTGPGVQLPHSLFLSPSPWLSCLLAFSPVSPLLSHIAYAFSRSFSQFACVSYTSDCKEAPKKSMKKDQMDRLTWPTKKEPQGKHDFGLRQHNGTMRLPYCLSRGEEGVRDRGKRTRWR